MIKVFVLTTLGEECFTFDYHSEALAFATKLGSIINCDMTIYNNTNIVDRQSWYNGYVQYRG